MDFIVQLGASAIAVGLLVALAAWARIARPTPPLDEEAARRILADEFPAFRPGQVWITDDGEAALARAGDTALVLRRSGDGYVARSLPWVGLASAKVGEGRVTLDLRDIGAPRFRLAWPAGAAWPPAATT